LLKRVPFFWPMEMLWRPLLVLALPLLALFWWFDPRSAAADPLPGRRRPLHFRGGRNLALLALVIATVLAQSAWQPGEIDFLGVSLGIERLLGSAVFLAAGV